MSFLNKMLVAGIALGCAGFVAGVAAISVEEEADIAAQCRQEAEMYAIPEEQLGEYIDGCILAMGGMPGSASGDAQSEEMTPGEPDTQEVMVEEVSVDSDQSGYADDGGSDAP